MRNKKIILIFILAVFTSFIYAQTKVDSAKLGKTLGKNKDANAIFVSNIKAQDMELKNDGAIIIYPIVKNKIKIVSDIDMSNIQERLKYADKFSYAVTFIVKDISTKTYAIAKIEGIETLEQYNIRIDEEKRIADQKEKERLAKERLENIKRFPVQIVNLEVTNITGTEAAWLPGQVQDKLKSNLQDYLGMKTVVDSKSETALKKIQAESESEARDENTAIELGKITTAKFAVFTKLRKTGIGYTVSVDFTDLTTGEQMASVTSKEYSNAEYLYGATGAVDELTLALANKLNLKISDISKNLLTSGSASFSVEEQLALVKQNEEQYKKMMKDYDDELSKLKTSNDINAIQNKNRIEAEKALLTEKQNAEKKRQEELKAQKERADEDAKLEVERSIALKTQRDQMAKDAAAKAEEVRKLKMEKQGVLGQINIIESKKKALVEIRQSVEERSLELYDQLVKDRDEEEKRIRNKSYSTVELGSDGNPTEAALKRRENQIIKSYKDLTYKFFDDCESVKQSTMSQQNALLREIRADQRALVKIRTVSSMGEELKVSFGKYEGSQNGWNAYLSLYSDGVLLYTDNFIVSYEALSGEKAPSMETELDDVVIEEYTNKVDMYNSLLVRGDPIIYFEIDYTVTAERDDKPSEYKFNFNKIRVINTVSGKISQFSSLPKIEIRTMNPKKDIREIEGIEVKEKNDEKVMERYFNKGLNIGEARKEHERFERIKQLVKLVSIPGKNIEMLKTEVTQDLYRSIIGSIHTTPYRALYPVDSVRWYDAIYFCNQLSELFDYTPVYSLNGNTDVASWNYTPNNRERLYVEIRQNLNANGFRLPTLEEWQYAAKGGENYKYAGSDDIGEVCVYDRYCSNPVAEKKANGYGLYDMSGNMEELVWRDFVFKKYDFLKDNDYECYVCGGSSYDSDADSCKVNNYRSISVNTCSKWIGFRICRTLPAK